MHNHRIILLFIAMSVCLHPASAQTTRQIEMRDVTVDRVKSHEQREDENRRQLWGLSQEEWARYKTLMQGIRGSISPANISPIEVLGTHARNDRERRRYAELWARMRHDDVGRVLAFQRAYDEAFDKLYGDEKMIDVSKLDIPQPLAFGANDRILLFVKSTRCPECERVVQAIMLDSKTKAVQLDIYFMDLKKTGKTSEKKIREWVAKQELDRQRLKSGRITLNYDNGNLYRITRKLLNKIPMVFKASAHSIQAIQI